MARIGVVKVMRVSNADTNGTTTGQVDTECALAAVLADVTGKDDVPVHADFFDDLGADSMVMARFCARVRKRADLPSVSMKDVYRHPTIERLAAALPGEMSAQTVELPAATPAAAPTEGRTGPYLLCGATQILIFVGYVFVAAYGSAIAYRWIAEGAGLLPFYLRSVAVGAIGFAVLATLPVLAKWCLIGRWTPRQIRLWSPDYLRFWVVKSLVRSNPLVRVGAGSPLVVLYLRALGAKVGRGVAIFSHSLPVCTDLVSIGDGTVVRKDSLINGYRAHAGFIETGPVGLGRDVVVGELTVLEIGTSMGDGAQLGHASSLHAGQAVPAGERWHGSPAVPAGVDYGGVEPVACGGARRASYAVMQLVIAFLVYLPLLFGGVDLLLAAVPRLTVPLGTAAFDLGSRVFYEDVLVTSAVVFFGFLLLDLLVTFSLPRLLNLAITPGKVYRLYGIHYSLHRAILRLTNRKTHTYLFGDSSYIVHYLRMLGYDLALRPQTGSNFGTEVRHETPYLSSVGTGTMVADGLSMMNGEYSSSSFRVSRTAIGAHNFLGNRIGYPPGGRTGENCLLATKVMVPIDGPERTNVGLLGSPPFEIPRSVERDIGLEQLVTGSERERKLRAKNRYNLRTLGLALLVRWLHVVGLTVLALAAADLFARLGATAIALEILGGLLWTMAYFVFVERAAVRFRSLQPRTCSIYDPYFWWHERYWKLVIPGWEKMLVGTPVKNLVSRLLGVRIGRRVFDDGCFFPERTLVTVGDDCTLNAGTVIQTHSQEDGGFKSDRSRLGDGVTLDVNAFVHYGVVIGDGARIGPDSFLMKGEEVPDHARWAGNPAHESAAALTPAATS